MGFGSFLTYPGYGYLDTWHGVATLVLLPVFVASLSRAQQKLVGPKSWRTLLVLRSHDHSRRYRAGRILLPIYGAGLTVAGATIMDVGMTSVFVREDLAYIGLSYLEICGLAEPLVPIIAHDRAGFGGGLASIGITLILLVLHAPPTPSFRQVMLLAGFSGFTTAIGVHFIIGYIDARHLAPAFAGAGIFLTGWTLMKKPATASNAVARTPAIDLLKVRTKTNAS